MPYAHITGWGISVPEPVLTNDDIAKMVDTNDEWIRDRTGIRERRIAREDEFPSTLGINAALKARGVSYSRFIPALLEAGIELNRKMLSEIAIADPATFDAIVEKVKPFIHVPQKAKAA